LLDNFIYQILHKKKNFIHLTEQQIIIEYKNKISDEHILALMATDQENTARIFCTTYIIVKNQRPYTNIPNILSQLKLLLAYNI